MEQWKDCWAAVRYADLKKETVKVSQITNFRPSHFMDFSPNAVYRIRTKSWNLEKKTHIYLGVIEELEGNFKNIKHFEHSPIVKSYFSNSKNEGFPTAKF